MNENWSQAKKFVWVLPNLSGNVWTKIVLDIE